MEFRVQDLGFSYGAYDHHSTLFSNISFSLFDGDILTILGPNGVGKTTLAKCLLGMQNGYQGDILIDETSIKSLSIKERAKLMGFAMVSTYEHIELTVLDYVCLGTAATLSLLSSPSSDQYQQAAQLCTTHGIGHLINRKMSTLSQGEQQLASLVRILVQNPRIILLDEPTASLDLKNQRQFLTVLQNLGKKGKIVIQISHDPNHVLLLGGKALLLSKDVTMFGMTENIVNKATLSMLYGTNLTILYNKDSRAVAFSD